MKRFILRISAFLLIGALMMGLSACSLRKVSDVSLDELTMMETLHDPYLADDSGKNLFDIVNHRRGGFIDDRAEEDYRFEYFEENIQKTLPIDSEEWDITDFVLTEDCLFYLAEESWYWNRWLHRPVKPGLKSSVKSNAIYDAMEAQREWKHCLYSYRAGASTLLAENVAAFCWDSERIVYCDYDGNVYALKENSQPEFLFCNPARASDPDKQFYDCILLATPDWVVLGHSWVEDSYVFRTKDRSLSQYKRISEVHGAESFIFRDWLILWGESDQGAQVLDLTTGQIKPIDLQINSHEHNTGAAACVYQGKLIITCEILPWRHITKTTLRGTYVLDCETQTVEKIDDFFYPTLIATEDRIFGIGEHGEVYDVLPK